MVSLSLVVAVGRNSEGEKGSKAEVDCGTAKVGEGGHQIGGIGRGDGDGRYLAQRDTSVRARESVA